MQIKAIFQYGCFAHVAGVNVCASIISGSIWENTAISIVIRLKIAIILVGAVLWVGLPCMMRVYKQLFIKVRR